MSFWTRFRHLLKQAQEAAYWEGEAKRLDGVLHNQGVVLMALQKYARNLETPKPPQGGQEFPVAVLDSMLPVRPLGWTDDPLLVLPLAEWLRFLKWVTPIARHRPYIKGLADCDDYVHILVGRATEWEPRLAIGRAEGYTAKGTPHVWCYIVALDVGVPRLFWVDLSPRNVTPDWGPEGPALSLPMGWTVKAVSWL